MHNMQSHLLGKPLTRNGQVNIKEGKLQMSCTSHWQHLPRGDNLSRLVSQRVQRREARLAEDPLPMVEPRPNAYHFTCPRCKLRTQAAHRRLVKGHRWTQLQCQGCSLTTVSHKWTCDCNCRWHQCNVHRKHGFLCGPREKQRSPRNIRRKASTRLRCTPGLGEGELLWFHGRCQFA